jgi:hypothetical protein
MMETKDLLFKKKVVARNGKPDDWAIHIFRWIHTPLKVEEHFEVALNAQFAMMFKAPTGMLLQDTTNHILKVFEEEENQPWCWW